MSAGACFVCTMCVRVVVVCLLTADSSCQVRSSTHKVVPVRQGQGRIKIKCLIRNAEVAFAKGTSPERLSRRTVSFEHIGVHDKNPGSLPATQFVEKMATNNDGTKSYSEHVKLLKSTWRTYCSESVEARTEGCEDVN